MRVVLTGLLLIVFSGIVLPVAAMPIPSKTAPNQSLAQVEADLAAIHAVLGHDDVARALAENGLTPGEIEVRLAQLSPEEVHALASQIDQLQAAGVNVPRYIWILLAVFLGVLIVTAIF